MTTAAERAVERLERRLFGPDGNGNGGAIGEIKSRLRPVEEWVTAQKAIAEAEKDRESKAVSTAQVQRTAAIFENVKLNRSNLQVAALLGIVAALPNILTLVIGFLSG